MSQSDSSESDISPKTAQWQRKSISFSVNDILQNVTTSLKPPLPFTSSSIISQGGEDCRMSIPAVSDLVAGQSNPTNSSITLPDIRTNSTNGHVNRRRTYARKNPNQRRRQPLTAKQRQLLQSKYDVEQYVTYPERMQLASQVNLSEYQIKVWFQNRRSKEKRQQRGQIKEIEKLFRNPFLMPPLPMLDDFSIAHLISQYHMQSIPSAIQQQVPSTPSISTYFPQVGVFPFALY